MSRLQNEFSFSGEFPMREFWRGDEPKANISVRAG